MSDKEKAMTIAWFKRHIDTILVLFAVIGGGLTFYNKLDAKFDKIDLRFDRIEVRLLAMEKDITIMKTVLITKNFIQPEVFAKQEGQKTND
jgi:hypothetical protein